MITYSYTMTTTQSMRQLEAAGFTREQAEAILDSHAGELTTRADLAELTLRSN